MNSGLSDNGHSCMDDVEKDDENPVADKLSGVLDLNLAVRKDEDGYDHVNADLVDQVPMDLNQQQLHSELNSSTFVNGSSDGEMENDDNHLEISNGLFEDKSGGDTEEKDGCIGEAASDLQVGFSHDKRTENVPDGSLELLNRGNHTSGTSDIEIKMEVGKSDTFSPKSGIGHIDNDRLVDDLATETCLDQPQSDELCEGSMHHHLKINQLETFPDEMQKSENELPLANGETMEGGVANQFLPSADQLRRSISPYRNASSSPRSPDAKKVSHGNGSEDSRRHGSQEQCIQQLEASSKHHVSNQGSPMDHFEKKRTTLENDYLEDNDKQNILPNRTTDSPRSLHEKSSRRRDNFSQGHVSPSSKGHHSSPGKRHGRSLSRSPSRHKKRKDDSSSSRRDYRDRSRSRSPYTRDHYRRSPRRYSPRRRSPPSNYRSHQRSPRRRQWSPPRNRSTGVGKPGNSLFVAGFSFVTTEKDLERKFSRFGHVTNVRVVRDRRSGDSRGFGFLSLERDEDADAAIRALDQTEWNGRIVLVEKSKLRGR